MQGFNMGRYYPPSSDPPQFNTSSSLRAATKRTSTGAQTVRFEMPFHVWCGSCPRETIIPQGVRFNAAKQKVGMYHSTSIWAFRIKHTICGGELEIRTNPKEGEYVVHEGGRRRDFGGEKEGDEKFLSPEERDRRRNDAFATLEGKKEEAEKMVENKERVEELLDARERDWSDPYAASRRVRKGFRRERKLRARDESEKEAIKDKYGLAEDMVLVDEVETDRVKAGLVGYGLSKDPDGMSMKPLYRESHEPRTHDSVTAVRSGFEHRVGKSVQTQLLQQQLRGNTRAHLDPFRIEPNFTGSSKPRLDLIRRPADQPRALKTEKQQDLKVIQEHGRRNSSLSALGSLDYTSD